LSCGRKTSERGHGSGRKKESGGWGVLDVAWKQKSHIAVEGEERGTLGSQTKDGTEGARDNVKNKVMCKKKSDASREKTSPKTKTTKL